MRRMKAPAEVRTIMTCDCLEQRERKADELGRSVSVNARFYKLILGQEPRGVRSWRFAMGATTGVFEVADASYETARRIAVARARRVGVDYITVLP